MTRRWYLLSLVPVLFGLMVFVLCLASIAIRVGDMPRLAVPGERTINLDGGKYILYGEGEDDTHDDALRCSVHDSTGASLPVISALDRSTYYTPTHEGRALHEVFVPHPGDHVVACTMTDGARGAIAIGRRLTVTLIVGITTLILGVVGGLLALFLLSRKRARIAQAAQVTTGS